jgi:uncharacterized cupredoxin-like copper-binding protein
MIDLKNTPFRLATILAISFALILVACGDDDDANGTSSDRARTISIVASDQLRFDPDTITIKVGQEVTIELDNSGAQVQHDWTVDDINAVIQHGSEEDHDHDADADADSDGHADPVDAVLHLNAAAGEVHTLVFTAEEPGTYTFYCSIPGHREGGMEGTIIVEE